MKKLVMLAFLGIGLFANAQVGFYPGIRVGANFSKYTNANADLKAGIYVGFFGELKLGSVYSLQPEISYSSQGANNVKIYKSRCELPENTEVANVDYRVDYLSVGLVQKFRFDQDKVNFHFGGLLDFEVGENYNTYSRRYHNGVDIGFLIGVSYKLSNKMYVEARYKQGLVDQLPSSYLAEQNNGGTNINMALQIGVTYSFR